MGKRKHNKSEWYERIDNLYQYGCTQIFDSMEPENVLLLIIGKKIGWVSLNENILSYEYFRINNDKYENLRLRPDLEQFIKDNKRKISQAMRILGAVQQKFPNFKVFIDAERRRNSNNTDALLTKNMSNKLYVGKAQSKQENTTANYRATAYFKYLDEWG